MMTLRRLTDQPFMVPQTAVWYLTDLAERVGIIIHETGWRRG